MAKPRKKPDDAVATFSPRMLVYWHGADRCSHALAWVERRALPDAQPVPVAVHVLRVDGGPVVMERHPGADAAHMLPTTVRTTVTEFEEYLRARLRVHGGSSGAFEALGVERPKIEVVVSQDTQADHDELYRRAAAVMGVPEEDLRKKYGHLNPGLQAMNLRNRLRAKGQVV